MNHRQSIVIAALFALFAGIAAWLQFGLPGGPGGEISASQPNDPDYSIENFISTGIGRHGKKYRITAERLVHYPVDDRALLERPRVVQYAQEGAVRRIHAESAWLYDDAEMVLSGNVRVIESGAGETVTTAKRMRIHLEDPGG